MRISIEPRSVSTTNSPPGETENDSEVLLVIPAPTDPARQRPAIAKNADVNIGARKIYISFPPVWGVNSIFYLDVPLSPKVGSFRIFGFVPAYAPIAGEFRP